MYHISSQTYFASLMFVLGLFLFGSATGNILAQEPHSKPTRDEIVAFLDEFRNMQLSEEESKVGWNERIKVDLVVKFGSDFSGLDLSSIDFDLNTRKVLAIGADFSGCNMQAARFDGADLHGTRFIGADLSNAMIRYCECRNSDFSNSTINGTRFLYSKMQNVTFANLDASQSSFYDIDFSGGDLSNTDFSGAKFWYGGNFSRANLSGAGLSHVHLENAEFIDAGLNNAKFIKANLYKADFSGADLEGADFTGATLYAAVFNNVTGIDQSQKNSLESRSMRWFYDFTVAVWGFLEVAFFPGFIAATLGIIVFSVCCCLQKEKSKLLITGMVLNCFAFFSTACTVLMIFSGGNPVRQMSQGNMDVWSTWLSVWPILALGMFLTIAVSLVVFLVCLARIVIKKRPVRPWITLSYLFLTAIYAFWSLNWLIMFMPDA